MATSSISMTKWVDITSGSLPAGGDDRELILRVITDSAKITPDKVYECTDAAGVRALFGEGKETAIAEKYFSYISNSATKPAKISFWRPGYFEYTENTTAKGGEVEFSEEASVVPKVYKTGDTITSGTKISDTFAVTLDKMAKTSDNFATIMVIYGYEFTSSEEGISALKTSEPMILDAVGGSDYVASWSANAIASWVGAQNRRFRYAFHVDITKLAKQVDSLNWATVEGAEAYLSRLTVPGVTAVLDDAFVNGDATTYPEWFTCALLAATKYTRANATIIQDFKGSELGDAMVNVTCDNDSLYDILTELNVNFFGYTQKAGKKIRFYMEGYDLDGTDTSVGDNEIWLKDRIVTEVFNRFLKANKVPAGSIGVAMIKAAISGVISEALTNLAITPEKTISDADRAAIIQNTGAQDAPNQIYTNGYYLAVVEGEVGKSGKGKRRTVDYILYYSTGEGVRKVTGSHVMV